MAYMQSVVCPSSYAASLKCFGNAVMLSADPAQPAKAWSDLRRLRVPCSHPRRDQDTLCWNQVPAEIALKIVSKIKVRGRPTARPRLHPLA